jgi:hypothetical protein
MKRLLLLTIFLISACIAQNAAASPTAKVLLVTGGHGFEREPFFKLFDDNPAILVTKVEHAKESATAFDRDDLLSFNAVVLYDMPMVITETQKQHFLALFEKGVGLVVLHHALVSYQDWPDYERIIGGRYPKPPNGQPQVTEQVGYHHDEEVPIAIIAKDHPITQGLTDFTIHDEIYWGFRVGGDVTPLFTTTHPKSGRPLAWTRTEGKSRVVYLQLGHDHQAWQHPNYPVLVARAIQWAASK